MAACQACVDTLGNKKASIEEALSWVLLQIFGALGLQAVRICACWRLRISESRLLQPSLL